ncbi:MAG: Rossman fold protein, TIGR00730 family [Candidatus Zambryskibacteria bacterium RIFCSPHIGHO2_02_FULL_43_14]|uniref:Cytokinin riboside 5'-monophosphate phosphoribohydrolase n=1 Tax=Candidatus Zambryskibacteria bacterium RIFCSPHIGHO2_02_FULL_43_14 TaxID=1802748 RepID=A0A1G2TFB9_9BACT|nr:MAG: Rossman fold protein, TIGR00730 family [Candidatus Zambryskibacteria bacterium RIFCSPHIGHO2_01_FULL_43_60]OHA95933.1 MAG: Rossman fold protein, TIGR00730 family [Candidatus Zambryskibacteria bacterium RIFCSPHIGHO2_02_FULL_43_14]OHB03627.1 MAG: Rossman fold protein, TIGR00730 family [Candidatus Zambryskibacteria bacterium RIFCSPLOWO2_01_FULL_42_41]
MKESTENILTLDRVEMHRLARRRVSEISKEFTEGFEFLEDYQKSVTFFGANQFKEDNPHYADARKLASRIVKELDYSVLSGGGPGIMEAANRGAFEAGGDSLGLLIKLPSAQVTNKYITTSSSFYYFFVRKVCLTFSSEAFIFYPGGFGTLDEFFEILTLIQTRKITHIPLICVGSEYWNELKKFMEREILRRGAIEPEDINLFHIVDDHDKIIEIIKSVPVHMNIPFNGAGATTRIDESRP